MTAPVTARVGAASAPSLVVAFAGAVAVRAALAGPAGAASVRAGLVFALLLAVFAVAAGARPTVSLRAIGIGLAVGAVLVLPALAHAGVGATQPAGSFPAWAAVTAVVATAEEAFLRGALFDAVSRRAALLSRRAALGGRGVDAAIVVGAIAFAMLHVPLYGWHAVPLDLAVGLVLGATRALAGTWTAPALAHVGADLVGWWLL